MHDIHLIHTVFRAIIFDVLKIVADIVVFYFAWRYWQIKIKQLEGKIEIREIQPDKF